MFIAVRPYLAILILWALYFHPLILHPTQVLYSDFSDFLAEHLPAHIFVAREWQSSGTLPLWNPYHYCGSPLVHDIQVGLFYPPFAGVMFLKEGQVGPALSWIIALHVLAGGLFAFLYARSNNLGNAGAFLTAVGFMFSAKWMTHLLLAGHSITIGLAWLPLVLLGLESGIRSGRIWPVLWAGFAYALLLLGTHPQWSFYAGVFAAAWTFGLAGRTRAGILRWLACGLGTVLIAMLLTAVQLLPTLEAAGYSARSVGLEATQSIQVGLNTMFGLVGPSAGYDPPATWEMRALFGLFWLAAALAAPALAGGRAKWQAGVFLGMLAFSLGGAVLIEWLPGFNLFRVPSRMLLVAAFPLAFLAGSSTDALIRTNWSLESRVNLRRAFLVALVFALVPAAACQVVLRSQGNVKAVWANFLLYWGVLIIALPIMFWLVLPGRFGTAILRTRAWILVLLAELLAPTLTLPQTKAQEDIYPNSGLVGFFKSRATLGEHRVMDIDAGSGPHDRFAPLGGGSPLPLVAGFETARGYNPLDVVHYREFIGFIVNDDTPVLSLSPVAQPIVPNFGRSNRALFDLLNVRYLVCYPDYLDNAELQKDPAHHLDPPAWVKVKEEPTSSAVPALPPQLPKPMPPVLVFENLQAMPRAFVVPEAKAIPVGEELAALKACDFRRTVLLTTNEELPPNGTRVGRGDIRIREYHPNRVVVQLDGRPDGGFLVLSDVWFPGWHCHVDGVEVPVHRANHAFRAVAVPGGAKEAIFTFEPRSYRIGWWISAITLGLFVLTVVARPVIRAPARVERRGM